MLVRLEPAGPRSLVKHSTTEQLRSHKVLGELTRGLMGLNPSPELLTSWFQRRFLIIFYVSTGANDPQGHWV